jgi:hypothetical protein
MFADRDAAKPAPPIAKPVCRYCGADVEPDCKFCIICGMPVDVAADYSPRPVPAQPLPAITAEPPVQALPTPPSLPLPSPEEQEEIGNYRRNIDFWSRDTRKETPHPASILAPQVTPVQAMPQAEPPLTPEPPLQTMPQTAPPLTPEPPLQTMPQTAPPLTPEPPLQREKEPDEFDILDFLPEDDAEADAANALSHSVQEILDSVRELEKRIMEEAELELK